MAKNSGYNFFSGLVSFVLVLLTIVASVVCIGWAYLTITDKFPKSITTSYISQIENEYGQNVPVMSANYYSAENGTGEEMFELRLTYYTSLNKTAVKSYGIQFFKDKFYYYDTYKNISWSSVSEYDEKVPMVIEIGDKTYGIALEGTYQKATINIWKTVWFGVSGLFTGWTNSYERIHDFEMVEYTYEDFFGALKQHIIYNSSKSNAYDLPLVELSDYFTLYEVKDSQLVKATSTTFDMSYFSIACKSYQSGVVYAEQSMFGMVGNEKSYNTSGIARSDFYKYNIKYDLTLADFDTRELANGDLVLNLNSTLLRELANSENMVVTVTLNLPASSKVVGLDYYALADVPVKEITINSTDARDFTINDYSLANTGLDASKIATSNVNLIVAENAFAEVVNDEMV